MKWQSKSRDSTKRTLTHFNSIEQVGTYKKAKVDKPKATEGAGEGGEGAAWTEAQIAAVDKIQQQTNAMIESCQTAFTEIETEQLRTYILPVCLEQAKLGVMKLEGLRSELDALKIQGIPNIAQTQISYMYIGRCVTLFC